MKSPVHAWPWLPLALGVVIGVVILVVFARGQVSGGTKNQDEEKGMKEDTSQVFSTVSEEQWRQRLTSQQFRVLRQKGTERAFTGEYWNTHTRGVYRCAACGQELFDSVDKYESGTGWPSFTRPIHDGAVAFENDRSLWEVRTEVHCPRCGGHLGHVFDDGPAPAGKRYCMNSVSLKLDTAATVE
ncbi:MAG: peptide-methionine (R)-S-oxide reductase MsrB [bacterium]